MLGGEGQDVFLDFFVFSEWDNASTVDASQVVMVVNELIAQFQLVFPADIQSVYNPELLKQGYGAVYARPINRSDAVDELRHGLRFVAAEGVKNLAAGTGHAVTIAF